MKIPQYSDVEAAANTIAEEAVITPLLKSNVLNEVTGANVFIKPENLQRTGSFKFRGAYNAIASLSKDEREQGILASSSGNHAQGIASTAKLFGCSSMILMPADAPKIKIERTKSHGAEVVFYDRASEDRDAVVTRLQEETGRVLIHPYNNFHVIAGQGSVGKEIAETLQEQNVALDRILVCTGGGGLTAGVALAINHHFPKAKVHPVEPEGFDDYKRSLEADEIKSNTQTFGSCCDAIITPSPGVIGFEINRKLLADGIVISDDEALRAVRFAYEELKLVVEPGGAAALAGLLQAGKKWQGENIAIIISGGNIDSTVFNAVLAE